MFDLPSATHNLTLVANGAWAAAMGVIALLSLAAWASFDIGVRVSDRSALLWGGLTALCMSVRQHFWSLAAAQREGGAAWAAWAVERRWVSVTLTFGIVVCLFFFLRAITPTRFHRVLLLSYWPTLVVTSVMWLGLGGAW